MWASSLTIQAVFQPLFVQPISEETTLLASPTHQINLHTLTIPTTVAFLLMVPGRLPTSTILRAGMLFRPCLAVQEPARVEDMAL
jgi:hypothetical protein